MPWQRIILAHCSRLPAALPCETDAMELITPAVSLTILPDACILTVLLFLDVQDALRFRRACRRLNLLLEHCQNDFWLPHLRRDFGVQLQV